MKPAADKKEIRNIIALHLLLTLLISSIASAAYIRIAHADITDSVEGNSAVAVVMIMSVCISVILSFSALTGFLNLKDGIRNDLSNSLIAFFIFPLVVTCCILLSSMQTDFYIIVLPPVIIFWLVYGIFYVRYRKKLHLYNPQMQQSGA